MNRASSGIRSIGNRREPWTVRFQGLMARRIRDVLLVSSDYDAFVLEEDGRIRERLFVEYSELNLVSMPTIQHVTSPAEALRALKSRRFDLVLTTMRVEDVGVRGLSMLVKINYPDIPVVLLVLDQIELRNLSSRPLPKSIDRIFLWTGDARILLAIIKLFEDQLNVDADSGNTGVQVIVVVEDSIRRYSTFLAMLYSELMLQSQSLIAEGVNAMHKLLRMRARPKILLATDYDQALDYCRRYRDHLLAVISDLQFPRKGELDTQAGFALADEIRRELPDLPILLQSARKDAEPVARARGLHFLDKNSPRLLRGIRDYLKDTLGFADFVFRLPDRSEVARARDMYELVQILRTVDPRSLHYHASRNHFNVWLRARCMFDVADKVREIQAGDFKDVEELRAVLLEVLNQAAYEEQEGVVADFSARELGPVRHFVRVGRGSIGGKGRSIAFIHSILSRHDLYDSFPGVQIQIPRTVAISTDEFDRFLEINELADVIQGDKEQELRRRFLAAALPPQLERDLRQATRDFDKPLAVRSSSLLEDSQHQSCAGIYETFVIPNQDPDPEERFRQLTQTVKAVYASTFSRKARAYLRATPFTVEEEKMAVIIQELVGQRFGDRYYPHISGVGLSYNYYPTGVQTPGDGVVLLALGLGQTIAEGGRSVRFCPKKPEILPHLDEPGKFLQYSQNRFYALDFGAAFAPGTGSPKLYDLAAAEEDGTLAIAGSVYSPDDDILRENLTQGGPRVITFNNVLKWGAIPLAEALARLLDVLTEGVGSPVELEFAVDMGDHGRAAASSEERRVPCLYLLQIRPLSGPNLDDPVESDFDAQRVLCQSHRSLGHGVVKEVFDLVFVDPEKVDENQLPRLAEPIAALNSRMFDESRPYLLVGPGRWGSSDASLGIPVGTSDITAARLIVEMPFQMKDVEPSQGSHFFHELVSLRIGYLTLPAEPHRDPGEEVSFLDVDWLRRQEPRELLDGISHFRFEQPLEAYLDGRTGCGTILKPGELSVDEGA
ncbi:MAG: hypothetical protein HY319_13785 [Armatimonadetes bacterium]|nr:hypothetical protein [Armatimonadota bacterium]